MNGRLDKLRTCLRENRLEAILVTDPLNERYLSNFKFEDGYLLITMKNAYLVTDFRYYEEASRQADGDFEIVMPKDRAAFVHGVFAADWVKTVGYEDVSLTCAEFARMTEAYPEVSFSPVGDMFAQMRLVKDEEEIRRMTAAQRITDAAFAHIVEYIRPTMTECDVALELDRFMRANGAEGISFETIAVSGTFSALPHGRGRRTPLEKGFLAMDFGAFYDGYCSDMTRTVCIGKADDDLRRVYETVLMAQGKGLAAVRAGACAYDVDRVAREVIEGAGYVGTFGHGLGHGVGMYIHEAPSLSPREAAKSYILKAGNVVTVEPGIYLQGKYGCRIEDMVLVTEEGCYDFTKSPKELIEIY